MKNIQTTRYLADNKKAKQCDYLALLKLQPRLTTQQLPAPRLQSPQSHAPLTRRMP